MIRIDTGLLLLLDTRRHGCPGRPLRHLAFDGLAISRRMLLARHDCYEIRRRSDLQVVAGA